MDLNHLKNNLNSTPAYVFDENIISSNIAELVNLRNNSDCQVLYSVKALPLEQVLNLVKPALDGFSVSSLFEARIAKETSTEKNSIHITSPGLRDHEFKEITELCSHISFNSITQSLRLQKTNKQASLGLRLNPKLSFAKDQRFDPCRPFSKLGIALDSLTDIPKEIEGIHFHTVFSNTDYLPLEKTIHLLEQQFGAQLKQLKWLNMGGGYLYPQINNQQPFIDLVKRLKSQYGLEIFIEPGKAVVGNAGFLVTSVIDCFISDGKNIAVLDTSVNHNPEVFEYQKSPHLLQTEKQGNGHPYLLVGSSCLAGDIFGEYTFKNQLKIGDRLVFSNVGAYSLIKANRFNGYNLPDVYWLDKHHKVSLIKHNDYQDYRKQW